MNLPLLCLVAASLSPLFRVASARQQTQRPFATGSSTRNYTFVVDPSRLTVNNYAVHLMLESNINQATDGGIYSNLLINRAFQDDGGSVRYWDQLSPDTVMDTSRHRPLSEALHTSAFIAPGPVGIGFSNPGWPGGIAIRETKYRFSFYARLDEEDQFKEGPDTVLVTVEVSLKVQDRATGADANITLSLSPQWKLFEATLEPTGNFSDGLGRLEFKLLEATSRPIYFSLFSLFPPKWHHLDLRVDAAEALAQLRPKLVRVPGGNDLEGLNMGSAFDWEKTIGPLVDRPGRLPSWQGTGWNTESFGLHEMLDMIEQFGAEACLGLFAGTSLDGSAAYGRDMDDVARHAVDELHYITDEQGAWADKRAQNGRKDPWSLHVVQLGNEENYYPHNNSYQSRFNVLQESIIREFGTGRFEIMSAASAIRNYTAVDIHDYNSPQWFRDNYDRLDHWTRNDTRIYELEMAVLHNQEANLSPPNWGGSLSECIYMLGLERNGDLCYGSAYAPSVTSFAYNPNAANVVAIGPASISRSTSYFCQQAFSLFPTTHNTAHHWLNQSLEVIGPYSTHDYPLRQTRGGFIRRKDQKRVQVQNRRFDSQSEIQDMSSKGRDSVIDKKLDLYKSVGVNKETGQLVIRLVNFSSKDCDIRIQLDPSSPVHFAGGQGSEPDVRWTLQSENLESENTPTRGESVRPRKRSLQASERDERELKLHLEPYALDVVTVALSGLL